MTNSSETGAFQRKPTQFRDWIRSDSTAAFQPESGRYHLYISRACPWAHGAALTRSVLGLEETITMDVVDPYREERGWQFSPEKPGCTPDTVNQTDYLESVYRMADSSFDGRPTVPVLWDRASGTIVNNESAEIMKMFADSFGDYQTRNIDLYPEAKRAEIDRIIEDLYEPINNGVYKAGFAQSQSAYERAVDDLFGALDRWDDVLDDQRYLVGDRLTIADLRLFPTLVRFDTVYHTHFKCNVKRVVDYQNLWEYTKDIYQRSKVSQTVNMQHITEHYYTTHTDINPRQIVARGPDLPFTGSHDRAQLSGD